MAEDPDTGPAPLDATFAATYTELRALAARIMSRERPGHTLQPTALVNEAYLRLLGAGELNVAGRTHFVNLAAQAMRRILVEHARGRLTEKRGGGWVPVTLYDIGAADLPDQATILDLDNALRKLTEVDPRAARVVELRVFAGLTMEEIASAVGVTRRTVQTDWRIAFMWLRREMALDAQD